MDCKPKGRARLQVARARIDPAGRWKTSVKHTRTGHYRARVAVSNRYAPVRSVTRWARVR